MILSSKYSEPWTAQFSPFINIVEGELHYEGQTYLVYDYADREYYAFLCSKYLFVYHVEHPANVVKIEVPQDEFGNRENRVVIRDGGSSTNSYVIELARLEDITSTSYVNTVICFSFNTDEEGNFKQEYSFLFKDTIIKSRYDLHYKIAYLLSQESFSFLFFEFSTQIFSTINFISEIEDITCYNNYVLKVKLYSGEEEYVFADPFVRKFRKSKTVEDLLDQYTMICERATMISDHDAEGFTKRVTEENLAIDNAIEELKESNNQRFDQLEARLHSLLGQL
ncbi:hypothetical protein PCE1_002763 [Barthelona sp. PCE]